MNPTPQPCTLRGKSFVLAAWAAVALTLSTQASAVTSTPEPQTPGALTVPTALPDAPTLTASTANGQAVNLADLRGQVVLVMVWATNCPVCLSKMPEFRANLAGWAQQGFQIVSINTDRQQQPLLTWEAARQAIVPKAQQWPSVWAHAPGFATNLPVDMQLPALYVIDRQGKLRLHASGRVPAHVWDTIAELL